MDAPKPTTSNDLKTFEYSNLQNEKKYNWKFITSYDSIADLLQLTNQLWYITINRCCSLFKICLFPPVSFFSACTPGRRADHISFFYLSLSRL